ncbi:MAG: hypothetical protein KME11_17655 [Timaviella obliquedivisa GSE-PSE-MK23-08B]|nr:hypothetical protein [Timaviella obliquedivisa GSE-PSE-MK23-08B]
MTDRLNLKNLRLALLRLHKLLLDGERRAYEQTHGRVSPNELLRLVMHDEWFDWLHPISRLVVEIDDLLKAEEVEILTHANGLVLQAKTLLNPSEAGNLFEQKYYTAIQREPDVVLAHASLMEFLENIVQKPS